MSIISVCIPAFESKSTIAATIQSVLDQTFDKIIIHVGIEPTANYRETIAICEDYRSDAFIKIEVNKHVLGWGSNVRNLLSSVRTPYFIILPHDDILHPRYLEILYNRICHQPDVAVTYADMLYFGCHKGFKSLPIKDGSVFERLMSFYLGGAEAVPWRGVTRTSVLNNGFTFQNNDFGGYAVECEWAQNLIVSGRAIRIPQPLYFKRVPAPSVMTASRTWTRLYSITQQKMAQDHHRQKMLSGFQHVDMTRDERRTVTMTYEAAMYRRYGLSFLFDNNQIEDIQHLKRKISNSKLSYGKAILSRLNFVLARHFFQSGDFQSAYELAGKAVEQDKSHLEAHVLMAKLSLSKHSPGEAILWLYKAYDISAPSPEMIDIHDQCHDQLNDLYGYKKTD